MGIDKTVQDEVIDKISSLESILKKRLASSNQHPGKPNENFKNNQARLEQAGFTEDELEDLPRCAITLEIPNDPVYIVQDNFNYGPFDRPAIIGWLEKKGTNPVTRKRFSENDICDALDVQKTIDDAINAKIANKPRAATAALESTNELQAVAPEATPEIQGTISNKLVIGFDRAEKEQFFELLKKLEQEFAEFSFAISDNSVFEISFNGKPVSKSTIERMIKVVKDIPTAQNHMTNNDLNQQLSNNPNTLFNTGKPSESSALMSVVNKIINTLEEFLDKFFQKDNEISPPDTNPNLR